jgi:ubiquinone/menaquinone biosynthesis C-methylase UbiE
MTETERILGEYGRRAATIPADYYSLQRPANLFAHQQRSRRLIRLLAERRLLPFGNAALLDVGCGDGQHLLDFISWGAERGALAGIDLIEARIARAAARLGDRARDGEGAPDLRLGDATQLPWASGQFDIVHQSTVFTSVLDATTRERMASEMLRVLKPGGSVIWYDFLFDNPSNPNVRGVGASEIRRLFHGCDVTLERVTLAPPIARRLVPVWWLAAAALERLTVLNTHYLGVIRKPAS